MVYIVLKANLIRKKKLLKYNRRQLPVFGGSYETFE